MTSLRASIRTAVEVPRWAFDFYRDHLLLVVAISLPGAIHRFIAIRNGWGADLTIPANAALGILTMSSRLLLIGLVVWLSIIHDDRLRQVSRGVKWQRMKAFARFRWPSLLVQLLLVAGITLVSDIFLEQVVTLWIPDDIERTYLAALLAVKNPTIIAWWFIWMVGIVRQMMLYSPAESKDAESGTLLLNDPQ